MKLKSQFDVSLDFKPLVNWPLSLPAVAIEDLLIAGFNAPPDHPTYVHPFKTKNENSLLFLELYPDLSLCEIARLITNPFFSQNFSEDILLKGYQLHPNAELLRVLALLPETSESFQDWVSSKKVGYHELMPLLALAPVQREFLIEEVLKRLESKSEAVQRIEWLSDLIQMEKTLESLQNLSLDEVRKRRFPMTSSRDAELAQTDLHWPKIIRSQFKRRGDKGGFEIQFFAGTPVELTKTAQTLIKVAEEWNSNLNKNF